MSAVVSTTQSLISACGIKILIRSLSNFKRSAVLLVCSPKAQVISAANMATDIHELDDLARISEDDDFNRT